MEYNFAFFLKFFLAALNGSTAVTSVKYEHYMTTMTMLIASLH